MKPTTIINTIMPMPTATPIPLVGPKIMPTDMPMHPKQNRMA